MTKKVWKLHFVAGNPKLFDKAAGGEIMARWEAIEAAQRMSANGWRAWVEHHETGVRIYESDAEKSHEPVSR